RCTAISALMDGAPGIESVAPCVCNDCTRCVLAFTAAIASVGLGSAEKAIGGGSPVLRRNHAVDRHPADANKNQEPKSQTAKVPTETDQRPLGSSVLLLLKFLALASMRLEQFRQLLLNRRRSLRRRHHFGHAILSLVAAAEQHQL